MEQQPLGGWASLATKDDLAKFATRDELAAFRGEFDLFRAETRKEFQLVRTEIKAG